MKLYINLLFGLFLACWNTNAQECAPSLATADFFPNNIKTRLAIGGTIWKNFYNIPADQPPLEDQASILFAGSIWLGGIDTEQNLHLAAGTYGYYGLPDLDFYPGPIDENGSAHETTCANFDRHFSVTRNQINNFKADYSADG